METNIDYENAVNCSVYMEKRVEDQIAYMERKSAKNKRSYYQVKTLGIVAAATIPFLAIFSNSANPHVAHGINVGTAAIGAVLVILNALEQLKKYYENWVRYRSSAEQLQREKYLFLTRSAPYNDSEAYNKFVQTTESILSTENLRWVSDMAQKQQKSDGGKEGEGKDVK